MTDTFQACYVFTKSVEGGVSDDPADPGGLTNTGLTMDDMRRFARDATPQDLLTLTDAEKQAIYLALYFLPVAGWELPPPVALIVFDHAVLAGVGDSAKILQRQLLVAADGQIGRDTLAAMLRVPTGNLPAFVAHLAEAQLADLQSKGDATLFIRGWTARVGMRRAAAEALL